MQVRGTGVGISRTVVAVGIVAVVALAGGLYLTLGQNGQTTTSLSSLSGTPSSTSSSATVAPQSTSSTQTSSISTTRTSSSSSQTLTSTSATASSTSQSSTSSTTTSSQSTSSSQAFNFLLSTNLDPALIAPGGNKSYTVIKINPLSSSSVPVTEFITLNASVTGGVSVKFGSNPVSVSSDSKSVMVPLSIAVGASTAPGDYQVNIQATSGSVVVKYSFTAKVVQYLVYMIGNTFQPATLTVKTGSTVYWMSLDAGFGGDPGIHNVVFKSGGITPSGDLHQYDSYSYTFNSPGDYGYFCSYHPPGMTGDVTVSSG